MQNSMTSRRLDRPHCPQRSSSSHTCMPPRHSICHTLCIRHQPTLAKLRLGDSQQVQKPCPELPWTDLTAQPHISFQVILSILQQFFGTVHCWRTSPMAAHKGSALGPTLRARSPAITIFWVEEDKVTCNSGNSYSGRRTHREPPCVMQGARGRPGGISPPEPPLAKFAQQELQYPQGRRLVEPSLTDRLTCASPWHECEQHFRWVRPPFLTDTLHSSNSPAQVHTGRPAPRSAPERQCPHAMMQCGPRKNTTLSRTAIHHLCNQGEKQRVERI